MTDVFLTQGGSQIAREGFGFFGQHSGHVHLQHKVHAAAQVQPQIHGRSVQGCQPGGGAGQQIKRHHKARLLWVGHQGFLEGVFGFKLDLGIVKARLDGAAFQADGVCGQSVALQGFFHPRQDTGVHLDGGFGSGHLNRRRFPKKIGQGVDRPYE